MFRQYRLRDYRFSLILWVGLLTFIGTMVIGSADSSYRYRQIAGMVLGLVVMVAVSLIDYTWLLNFGWLMYIVGLLLLLAVLLIGTEVNNARRWLTIGIQFQPSDLEKLILILFFSGLFSRYENKLNSFKFIMLSVALIGAPLLLIVKEPDLSTTILTSLVFCAIIFTAGLSYKIIAGILAVVVPVAVLAFSLIIQPGQFFVLGYQRNRIMAWLKPEMYPAEAYQQQMSIKAIGSGQLYGKGLNNQMVSSVKGGNFLPESRTDFIFAVAGEELGFLGCCLIILLELLITIELIRIGRKARDLSGTLICSGLAALIMFQSTINIAVATGMMPNTGIPLPFVSYGVTSLLTLYAGVGIALNIGLQSRKY